MNSYVELYLDIILVGVPIMLAGVTIVFLVAGILIPLVLVGAHLIKKLDDWLNR